MNINHFYEHPYELAVNHPAFVCLYKDDQILNEMNLLLYGYDISLNKFHICKILSSNKNTIRLKDETINVLGVDITFKSCRDFIQINMKTHLNKEKTSMVEFIKNIIGSRKPSNDKHKIVILNLDYLNTQLQFKLRRIIEKSHQNASFICSCGLLSKVIPPLQSRFNSIRVPVLSNQEKKMIITKVFEMNHETKNLNVLLKYVKDVDYFQDIVALALSYNLSEETDSTKSFKKFKFIENDLKLLLSKFKKMKNTLDCIHDIRQFIYKLIHYNIDHKLIIKMVIDSCSTSKTFIPYMHQIVGICKQFDMDIININPCKVTHAYEQLFLSILLLF